MVLQLFLDSRDRASGTPSNFQIQLPQTLVLPEQTRGRIDDLRIPMCIPTIQSSVNDTINVQMGSSNYVITIPQAQYDGPALAAKIGALLIASIAGTWTSVYDSSNISMTISCSNAFTITGGSYGTILLSRAYTQTSNSYTFSYVPVQGADVLYLCSSTLTTASTSLGPRGAHDSLMSIVPTCGYGSVIDASMSTSVFFSIPPLTTQSLSFQLRDRNYNILNIVPNISFTLSIEN